MTINSGISATLTNTFTIGDGLSSNKTIYANTATTLKPGIRYNTLDGYFQKSNDGYNWDRLLTTADITPTTISYTIVNPNVYENATTTITATNNTSVQYQVYSSIRRGTDGYSHISVCNFGITALSGVYRFVSYDSNTSFLTAEQTCMFYESDDVNNTLKFTLSGATLTFSYKATVAGSTCVSYVTTTNFVQPTITNITKFRSADWWNGKTCSEWYLTQLQLLESQAMGGGPGQVCSYVHGATSVNAFSGTLSSNNRIYMAPASNQANWHYIDTNTGAVVAYAHGATVVAAGTYNGGVLAPNGRIYWVPRAQANQANWHYINTNTGAVTAYAHNLGGDTPVANAYIGGVLSPDGRIYLIPYTQSDQTKWHYINSSAATVTAYSHGATVVATAYYGGALSSNGRIYMAPYSQSNQANWHYINTDTGAVISYANNSGVTPVNGAYLGAVSANNKIYFIPYSQSNQANWHYIDTITGNVVTYANASGVTPVSGAYIGGVYSPNCRIYLIPYAQSNQATWHYIDTNTNTVVAYTHGITALTNGYIGGTLSHKGIIYMIPSAQAAQTNWHYIDTQSELPLNKNVCLNPMFNKY